MKELILCKVSKDLQEKPKLLLTNWKYRFLNSSDMDILARLIEDIIIVCGNKYETNMVLERMENLSSGSANIKGKSDQIQLHHIVN